YGGNPVSCAAALATIDLYERADLAGAARHIEDLAGGFLRALAEEEPSIAEVRGRGAMLAIELVRPGTLEPDAGLAGRVARRCAAQGVLILTCGTYGNVIRLLPPLVIDDELLLDGLEVLAAALRAEQSGEDGAR
uniref:aminotransferase class III-fold pyridoxal phosphate-dependent enzyme n=1 Tax=Actinotalea sp. TaxID=1872145 RepID=UPI0035655CAB